jgi:TusE/DsrC/DsvC family sulfur relay protein
MPVTTIDARPVHVNEEGYLTDPAEWDESLGTALAAQIGIVLGEEHWQAIRFLRDDFAAKGETPTLRRITVAGGIPTKTLFQLFPKYPAKKLAYVAGLPKPYGCV